MKRVSVLYLGLPNTQLFEFFTTLNDFPKLCTSFAGGHAFEWDDDELLGIGLGFESKCYFGRTMQWRLPSIMNRKMNSLRLWLRGLDMDINYKTRKRCTKRLYGEHNKVLSTTSFKKNWKQNILELLQMGFQANRIAYYCWRYRVGNNAFLCAARKPFRRLDFCFAMLLLTHYLDCSSVTHYLWFQNFCLCIYLSFSLSLSLSHSHTHTHIPTPTLVGGDEAL